MLTTPDGKEKQMLTEEHRAVSQREMRIIFVPFGIVL